MSASATTHAKTITDYILSTLEKRYKLLPHHLEGEDCNRWVVIDYLSVVVHIMLPEVREFYSLEKIWAKGKKVVYERKSKKSVKRDS